jgi:hypothetical protein
VRQWTIYPISDEEASDLEVTWAYLIMLIRCIRGGGVPNEATGPAGMDPAAGCSSAGGVRG